MKEKNGWLENLFWGSGHTRRLISSVLKLHTVCLLCEDWGGGWICPECQSVFFEKNYQKYSILNEQVVSPKRLSDRFSGTSGGANGGTNAMINGGIRDHPIISESAFVYNKALEYLLEQYKNEGFYRIGDVLAELIQPHFSEFVERLLIRQGLIVKSKLTDTESLKPELNKSKLSKFELNKPELNNCDQNKLEQNKPDLSSEDKRSSKKINIGLVPIPLHPRKKRKRGFNQTEYLIDRLIYQGNKIRKETSLGSTKDVHLFKFDVLRRTRYSDNQVGSNKKSRLGKYKDLFELDREKIENLIFGSNNQLYSYHDSLHHDSSHHKSSHKVYPDALVLIDDVQTTGSTLSACSEQLLELEVPVSAFTIAGG